MTKEVLQNHLLSNIPLATHIGFEVVDINTTSLIVKAPLTNNSNHLGTGFGGSIYCVGVLCGWGLLDNYLDIVNIKDAHIVIHKCEIIYKKPLKTDFIAKCNAEESQLKTFIDNFKDKTKSRIDLEINICNTDNEVCAVMKGKFVLIK